MIPGMMDKYILFKLETTTLNNVGTPIETYADLRNDFASISYKRSGTDFDEAAHPYTYTEFSTRWATDLNTHRYKLKIQYNSEDYKILHIQEIGRQDGLRFKCVLWDE